MDKSDNSSEDCKETQGETQFMQESGKSDPEQREDLCGLETKMAHFFSHLVPPNGKLSEIELIPTSSGRSVNHQQDQLNLSNFKQENECLSEGIDSEPTSTQGCSESRPVPKEVIVSAGREAARNSTAGSQAFVDNEYDQYVDCCDEWMPFNTKSPDDKQVCRECQPRLEPGGLKKRMGKVRLWDNRVAFLSSTMSENRSEDSGIERPTEDERKRTTIDVNRKNTLPTETLPYRFFDREQFVKGNWNGVTLVELDACQFQINGNTVHLRKYNGSYLLSIDQQQFVAKVSLSPLSIFQSTSIEKVKSTILKEIVVIEIFEDGLLQAKNNSLTKLYDTLKEAVNSSQTFLKHVTLFELYLVTVANTLPTVKLLKALNKSRLMPDEVRSAAGDTLEKVQILLKRRMSNFTFLLPSLNDYPASICSPVRQVRKIYEQGVQQHRELLIRLSPSAFPSFKEKIANLPAHQLLHITEADVGVVQHLVPTSEESTARLFVIDLLDGFLERVAKIREKTRFKEETPLLDPLLSFLCKSLWEILSEIQQIVGSCGYEYLLQPEGNQWKLAEIIRWPIQENNDTTLQHYYRSLESQYRFLFKLIKQFSPRNSTQSRRPIYKMQVLELFMPTILRSTSDKMCSNRSTWLCILDYTIDQVIVDKIISLQRFASLYEPLLTGYVTFVATSTIKTQESLRVVTNNVLKYIVRTCSIFVQHETETRFEQTTILQSQISCMTRVAEDMTGEELASSCFPELIDEYVMFWVLHSSIVTKNEQIPDFFADELNNLFHQLLAMISKALEKPAPAASLAEFLRCVNEFLTDYLTMEFPSTWYVKCADRKHSGLTLVANKIADVADCSYLVTDLEAFITSVGDDIMPPHFNVQIIRKLIGCVDAALEKSWISTKKPAAAQVDAACALLKAIRSSLVYLKEQPDYRDFKQYENESTQPFTRAVENSDDLCVFQKRVQTVGESFWYFRKTDEIVVERALEMIEPIFGDEIRKDDIKSSYDRYLAAFQDHLENTARLASTDEKVNEIVDALLCHREERSVREWDRAFKTQNLPDILAAVSAIWSLMKSDEVCSDMKLLRPHCIQILGIFRLLSIDRNDAGIKNHLAHILTGQGKSAVLALLSSVLALTGNDVFMACYSSYLVNRDEQDFEELFRVLKVQHKIKYITIDKLALKFLSPVIKGKKYFLSQFVLDHVLESKPLPNLDSTSSNFKNAVLLVDEVDVMFSEKVFGSSMRTCATKKIPGLAEIQEFMWKSVTTSDCDRETLLERTYQYIDSKVNSGDQKLIDFNALQNKDGGFEILMEEGDQLIKNKCSSRKEFFRKHLTAMADEAIGVFKTKIDNSCTINKDGLICVRNDIDGIFSTNYASYRITFQYFKLQSKDFDDMNGNNYGYIVIRIGHLSISKLPSEFVNILGVSGTLSNVYSHEKKAMREMYKIHSYTSLPSFFGSSNVKFDPKSDFIVLETEAQWKQAVFNSAYEHIASKRSVIIFFEEENSIESFVKDHGNKFAALNILTENTDASTTKSYISRAGVKSTLTLATRLMGRGVDYQSSLAVEKNGGVHVIQTFFSIDVKEETQIKGRTGRKDNKGSYELILLQSALHGGLKLGGNIMCYENLDQSRTTLMAEIGEKQFYRASKFLDYHKTTMAYYGLK